MATTVPPPPPMQNPPAAFDVFRFAHVRTPQKHNTIALVRRFINFTASVVDINSIPTHSLYNTLATHRLEGTYTTPPGDLVPATANFSSAPLNSRQLMFNDCIAFKSSTHYIDSINKLYELFPGFQEISEWLYKQGKNAVLSDLKTLIENKISQTINTYLHDYDYLKLKLRIWDNLFAETILAENFALIEELIKVIRILRLMERINEGDESLNDGQVIYEASLATVLLPENIFPLEPIVNATAGPITTPILPNNPEHVHAEERMESLNNALKEIRKAFRLQHMKYLKKLPPKEVFLKDKDGNEIKVLSDVGIPHDPLVIEEQTASKLSNETKSVLKDLGVELNFVHVPWVIENIERELTGLEDKLSRADSKDSLAVVYRGSIIKFGLTPAPIPAPGDQSRTRNSPPSVPQSVGIIKPIGIADLKVVQSQLLKYELGEVAHIENILKGEVKKRTFRNFNRTETTLLTEEETTTENEKETQTTERFEMQKESSKVVQEDSQSQEGFSISASFGFTFGSIGADYSQNNSNSTSQTESNRIASNYSKNVMERALSRVIERKRTQKTVTTIIEFEDTAEHSFINDDPSANNVAGVYRWVDKYYYNKVINYGKRLMFEFIVPEPACYYIKTGLGNFDGIPHAEPPATLPSNFTADNITANNFPGLAAKYGADVQPPPEEFKHVVKNVSKLKTGDNKYWDNWDTVIDIPTGYRAIHAKCSIVMSPGTSDGYGNYLELYIGHQIVSTTTDPYSSLTFDIDYVGSVGVVAKIHTDHYGINVELVCNRTEEAFRKWQVETFNAIVQAYNQRKAEYEKWLASKGVVIQGVNPGENRKIEKREFKKYCISMITGQRFDLFNAMADTGEISFTEASAEGKYIQFFEQAFEWEQVTYLYYPYFWGRKSKWAEMINHQDTDPLFTSFLQAGAARVVVPVRPGYDKAMLYYLSTGQIWNGGDVPAPNDPLFVSIIDELKEADGQFNGGNQEGEPWISKMPTNLVYLQQLNQSPPLPDFSAQLIVP